MTNGLLRITSATPVDELPYCIWFPQLANRRVYEGLVRLRPNMKLQAARACIVANYQPSFEKIDPPYDSAFVKEAQASPNPFFLKYLQAKEAQGDTTGDDYGYAYWKFYTIKDLLRASSSTILSELDASSIETTQDWIYDGAQAEISHVHVSICTPEEEKQSGISDIMFGYPCTE
jgi:hypothetical protein